jgi:glycosyltransferase involved in cell wall biosynthesis
MGLTHPSSPPVGLEGSGSTGLWRQRAGTSAGPEATQDASSARVPVTVIVPTLQEAKNLPRCLEHLRWAEEVVVVDSHSTDGTQEIAERYGARVLEFTWNGQWPKKRNWVLRHADLKHPWVLIVDADEVIVPELAREIAEAVKTDKYNGYYVNRRFIFLGKWLRHCGYYPSWNLRLLRRGYAEYEKLTDVGDTGSGDNEVHEHVAVRGDVAYLEHDMLHYAFPDIYTFVEKHNRYSNWEAAVQVRAAHEGAAGRAVAANRRLAWRRRVKTLSRKLPFRPTLRFLYSYIVERGFLDGYAGYIFCRLLGTYEFLSVAKCYELRQAERKQEPAAAPGAGDGTGDVRLAAGGPD